MWKSGGKCRSKDRWCVVGENGFDGRWRSWVVKEEVWRAELETSCYAMVVTEAAEFLRTVFGDVRRPCNARAQN